MGNIYTNFSNRDKIIMTQSKNDLSSIKKGIEIGSRCFCCEDKLFYALIKKDNDYYWVAKDSVIKITSETGGRWRRLTGEKINPIIAFVAKADVVTNDLDTGQTVYIAKEEQNYVVDFEKELVEILPINDVLGGNITITGGSGGGSGSDGDNALSDEEFEEWLNGQFP